MERLYIHFIHINYYNTSLISKLNSPIIYLKKKSLIRIYFMKNIKAIAMVTMNLEMFSDNEPHHEFTL